MAAIVQILKRSVAKELFNKDYNELTVKEKPKVGKELDKRYPGG